MGFIIITRWGQSSEKLRMCENSAFLPCMAKYRLCMIQECENRKYLYRSMEGGVTHHIDDVKHPFGQREGLDLEFKEAADSLPKSFFDTVCYEELGSGVRNVTKYLPFYAPGAGAPSFVDEDMFTVIVPLEAPADKLDIQVPPEVTAQTTGQVAAQVMHACRAPQKAADIQSLLGIKHRETFLNNYLNPLLTSGWIERTIPDKPKSRLQKYRSIA